MNETQTSVEKEAKAKALVYLNANRVKDGIAPLKRIERLYWKIYGARWMAGEIVQ